MAEKVSTSELYDNESVITQMYLTRKKCDSAVSTAETVASDVNDAVSKANAALASAEASASTVSGYVNRLSEIEAKAVRKTGETSQIVEGSLQLNGDLTVENEVITDNLNVDTINASEVNVGASCTVPDTETGTVSQYAANAKRVQADLDDYAPMMRLGVSQTDAGVKTFTSTPIINETVVGLFHKSPYYAPIPGKRPSSLVYRSAIRTLSENDRIGFSIMDELGPKSQRLFLVKRIWTSESTFKESYLTFRVNHTTGNCSWVIKNTLGGETTLASWDDPDLIDSEE